LARNDGVLSPIILLTAVVNGLMTGAVYALVALGLTLIYGVLHIINFAHGALLSAALFSLTASKASISASPSLRCRGSFPSWRFLSSRSCCG
jgi:branched-chain amino acid transport system permease protein